MCPFFIQNVVGRERPQVSKGKINFSKWDFNKGALSLKGNWIFYWKRTIDLEKLRQEMVAPPGELVEVPGIWNDKVKRSSEGYGTYLLELKGGLERVDLDLLLGPWNGSFSLYAVDKKGISLMGKRGRLKNSKESSLAEYRGLQSSFKHEEHSFLVLYTSNNIFRGGGTFVEPKLGLKDTLTLDSQKTLIRDFILVGFLWILGFLGLMNYKKKNLDKSPLYFGALCFVLSLGQILAKGGYFFTLFPGPSNLLFSLTKKCEYLGPGLSLPLICFYLNEIFLDYFNKETKIIIKLFGLLNVVILFSPVIFLTHLGVKSVFLLMVGTTGLYFFIKLGILVRKKAKFSKWVFFGGLSLFALWGSDELMALKGIEFPELLPWGMGLYLLMLYQVISQKHFEVIKSTEAILESMRRKIVIQEKVMKGNESEMNVLLDNIRQGIFTVNDELRILSPISKFTETLFRPDIEGVSVFEILFKNMKMTGQTFKKLYFTFKDMFSSDRMQFWAIEDNLPHKVDIYSPDGLEKRIYKISYSPLCDEYHNVQRVMFVVEDITQLEEYMTQTEKDQVNFKFIEEVLKSSDKEGLCKSLEDSIRLCLKTMEDFVSPIANSYDNNYFQGILQNVLGEVDQNLSNLENLRDILQKQLKGQIFSGSKGEIKDYQLESVEKVSHVVEELLRYAHLANLFFPINFSLEFSFNQSVIEKIKSLMSVFENIFRYAPGLEDLDKRKLAFITKVTRMYPDFDQTMLIIYQRSKLISFLLKAMNKDDDSDFFNNLSLTIKEIPKREKLNEAILKNNLVLPYRSLAEKIDDLKEGLVGNGKKVS